MKFVYKHWFKRQEYRKASKAHICLLSNKHYPITKSRHSWKILRYAAAKANSVDNLAIAGALFGFKFAITLVITSLNGAIQTTFALFIQKGISHSCRYFKGYTSIRGTGERWCSTTHGARFTTWMTFLSRELIFCNIGTYVAKM